MRRWDGVIFDLDGVLCSTDQYHYRAWKTLADRLGIPFDETVNHRLRGVSRMDSLEILLENSPRAYSPEEKSALAEEKNRTYRALLVGLRPADCPAAVRNTLTHLRRNGLLLAIGSSSRNAPLILEQLALLPLFDAVSDGNGLTRSKPDPEVFLRAAKLLGLPPEACLVVEDAPAGAEAARRGGFSVAMLGSEGGKTGADFCLARFEELLPLTGSPAPTA